MENVSNIVTTIISAQMKIIVWKVSVCHHAETVKIVNKSYCLFVPKKDVFRPLATNKMIADWATDAFLKNVSLDVNIKETVWSKDFRASGQLLQLLLLICS